ncbi:MAG: NUDIX hydrolase [Eggerthellaceae bacterium]|nr:NUDIX hydrolase [Eggerthellaceae bacterium]
MSETNDGQVVGPRDVLRPGLTLEYPVPETMREQAERYLDDPASFEVATPRLASTVMLLRPRVAGSSVAAAGGTQTEAGGLGGASGPGGHEAREPFEVFMLRRASTMAFVPDAVVFPGGSYDKRDDSYDVPFAGASLKAWARRMSCDEATARRAIVTAARELFEECGVLLATDAEDAPLHESPCDVRWAQARRQVSEREVSFGEFLSEHGLSLRADLLSVKAHWVTPLFEPRRYDTYFFCARLPQGQAADGLTTEAAASGWSTPRAMLDRAETGRALLMPPTIANLSALARAASLDEAIGEAEVCHVMLDPTRDAQGNVVMRSVIK